MDNKDGKIDYADNIMAQCAVTANMLDKILGSKMVGTKAEFVPVEEPIKYGSVTSTETIKAAAKLGREQDERWAKEEQEERKSKLKRKENKLKRKNKDVL